MPSINMIAARRAEKKRVEKMVYCTLLVILGELAITLGVVGFMTARVHASNVNIRQLDVQMTKLQPTVTRIKRYEGEIKQLEPRLNLLGQSRDQTMAWYTVVHDLARSMPADTWLTGIATGQAASTSPSAGSAVPSATLNLSGTSVSQKLVGETMLRLNQCPEFDQVDLTYTQESTIGEAKALQFQIVAKLKPITPQKGGNSKDVSN